MNPMVQALGLPAIFGAPFGAPDAFGESIFGKRNARSYRGQISGIMADASSPMVMFNGMPTRR